jgi:hypothetical protein
MSSLLKIYCFAKIFCLTFIFLPLFQQNCRYQGFSKYFDLLVGESGTGFLQIIIDLGARTAGEKQYLTREIFHFCGSVNFSIFYINKTLFIF